MTSRCLVFCFHWFCARSGDQEMILARNIDYRSILQKPLKQFGPAASKYEQSKMEIKEQLSVTSHFADELVLLYVSPKCVSVETIRKEEEQRKEQSRHLHGDIRSGVFIQFLAGQAGLT